MKSEILKRLAKVVFLGVGMAGGTGAWADPMLRQPIDCRLGETCEIQQFMDHDTGEGSRDFACGIASYDGHKGTDFRVSVPMMDEGVAVLAAADGVVLGLRDSMTDRRIVLPEDRQAVEGKECGNGVVLRHAEGWETQYCHMKLGSLRVQKRQKVKAGDPLGEVGLSGKTQFPHLHLSVRKDGIPVDPFAPEFDGETCAYSATGTLWEDSFAQAFTYQPVKVIDLGLADRALDMRDVVDGRWSDFTIEKDAPLVVYGLAVNGQEGDRMQLVLDGPAGNIVDITQDGLAKPQAQWFAFAGKRQPAGGWGHGSYGMTVRVLRDGAILHERSSTAELAP
ncbi:M23 family metallopeptidase [Neptunicoccus cionae]|uniref:M23 family metallopeptidase n=1 Tax=Neptunicoccus cionae TaxID=2035344 RepID=UPI000C76B181|nr:M23 family metallopeptidase [Amylibacter cionae]PLS20256.1 peptidase M24 [Amylibacter cionae]